MGRAPWREQKGRRGAGKYRGNQPKLVGSSVCVKRETKAMGNTKLADHLAYPPRAMRADRAAAYLSMSQSTFLRLVEEKLLPEPVKIKGMVSWDRLELDAAYEN